MLLLIFCGTLFSQTREFTPEIRRTEDGVRYISTGVGFDSRVNLPHFSVRMIFAARNGAYLADIDLEISPGPAGKPTRIHSSGPWLIVDLSPGKYKVTARNSKGQVLSKFFSVTKGRVTQVKLTWNISDEEI